MLNSDRLLEPIIIPLVSVVIGLIGTGGKIALGYMASHVKVQNQAALAAIAVGLNTVVQNATANAAGSILTDIRSGKLDVTNAASLKIAYTDAAAAVSGKVGDAIAGLNMPMADVITQIGQKTEIALAKKFGVPANEQIAAPAAAG